MKAGIPPFLIPLVLTPAYRLLLELPAAASPGLKSRLLLEFAMPFAAPGGRIAGSDRERMAGLGAGFVMCSTHYGGCQLSRAATKLTCLNRNWFESIEEARRKIEQWRVEYNEHRPHSALGQETPSAEDSRRIALREFPGRDGATD